MISEPIAVTLLVVQALENLNVPYLMGGSLASALYGVPRATKDTILAKLEWYQMGGHVSDRQWRDILGVQWAKRLNLDELLDRALTEAGMNE